MRHRKHRVISYCVIICCCRNVFTVPLPSNDRLYSFHYSGFQPSCHIALWFRRIYFRSRRRTTFIPRRMGLALPFPNCSLLRAARLERHGPFKGVPPYSATGGLQSSSRAPHLRDGPAFSLQLDGRLWNPSQRGHPPPPGVLPAAPPQRLHHAEKLASLLPFIQATERCREPGRRNVTSLSPSCSTRRLKFTDVPWECVASSSRINSVTLATNTRAVRGRYLESVLQRVPSRWAGHGNVFVVPLPSNDLLYSLPCSGFRHHARKAEPNTDQAGLALLHKLRILGRCMFYLHRNIVYVD
jgi:hypothetical protein